ncbi:helix-turn-helix domain-containing protein [Agrobacterium vitis]|uniref:helix-turn-helix domain-containing protein n=1 Tax=Agrobacterium vitis TaxID=373 RepID=UPI0018D236B6|nr:helix-turn-helix domain-containing protein [Agrobacterium vitis]
MAFDEVVVSKRSGFVASTSKISIGLDKRGSGPALAAITIGADAWMAFGMPSATAFVLLIGRGPDSGRIRLQRRDSGSVLVSVRKLAGGKKLYQLPLGHRPEFPDRREPASSVEWTIIDDQTFELRLPESWSKPAESLPTTLPVKNGKQENTAAKGDAQSNSMFRADLGFSPYAQAVLAKMVAKRGRFVTDDDLRRAILLSDGGEAAPSLSMVITQIRAKLPVTVWIKSETGRGYQISGDTNALLEAR